MTMQVSAIVVKQNNSFHQSILNVKQIEAFQSREKTASLFRSNEQSTAAGSWTSAHPSH
jgi:hypothetical protein